MTHQRLRAGSKMHALSHVKGKAAAVFTGGAYAEYVSREKWRPACTLARRSVLQRVDAKPLRRRQETPLTAFFNRPRVEKKKLWVWFSPTLRLLSMR